MQARLTPTLQVSVLALFAVNPLFPAAARAGVQLQTASSTAAARTATAASVPEALVAEEAAPQPFAFGDFTWLNGSNRQKTALLDTPYFTGSLLLDINYSYDFQHPKDDTITGSTVTGRHNEISILLASFGGDFHYKQARATLTLQFGQYATLISRNDPSVNRGQYDLLTAFRYIREANAGFHLDKWSGINVDAGIFMSYIGLFSYLSFENWAYQRSYVSDNTPFFFQGVRAQVFPNDRLKVELWLTNGWQSYAKYNGAPGIGFQILYRPIESLSLVTNGYLGFDTPVRAGRIRLHSDSAALLRYFNAPDRFLDKAAFSVAFDLGFEQGDGVTAFGGDGGPAQNFVGFLFYHRLWFLHDLLAVTIGGGAISNPGRYLVLVPPGPGTFDTAPGTRFFAWDTTATFDVMPDPYQTWRIELCHRHASDPYFAGPGGVTSPDGLATTARPADWRPDLRKQETRLIAALLFRM